MSETRARESIRALLAEGGTSALQVHDKPQLEAAFVAFAAGTERK